MVQSKPVTESGAYASHMRQVHDVFRREFSLLPALVQGVAPGGLERTAVVADHIDLLLAFLHMHHQIEDESFWPKLRERGSAETAALVDQMVAHHGSIDTLSGEVAAETRSWRASAACERGTVLTQALDALLLALKEHMAVEEEHAVPLIARHVTGAEWEEAREKGRAMIAPGVITLIMGMTIYESPDFVPRSQMRDLATRTFADYSKRVHGTATPRRSASTETRPIAQLIETTKRGPFTRIIEPQTSGDALKPFVALAHFKASPGEAPKLDLHPHSGIATFTLMLGGRVTYEDSTGKHGVLAAGSLEWLRAGAGAWHTENMIENEGAEGFQLWLALPPALEAASPDSQYVDSEEVEQDGPVRVVLGHHGGARSRVRAPESINYFHIRLQHGERWRYEPPVGHTVAWAFPTTGQLQAAQTIMAGQLAIFDESNGSVDFVAVGDTEFLFGSAVKHRHDLVVGYYNVHSSVEALMRGRAEIERIGRQLVEAGKIDQARLERDLERIRPGNW